MDYRFEIFLFYYKERNLEIAVVTVLEDSGAEDYIPVFARHRISIETLLQITDDDLKQVD